MYDVFVNGVCANLSTLLWAGGVVLFAIFCQRHFLKLSSLQVKVKSKKEDHMHSDECMGGDYYEKF